MAESGMKESDHPTSSGSNNEAKVIKRYSNRKLYDTVESRYVTLDEIAGMIKRGLEVKVIDNRSKEDLTSVTLAQIIFEEEKKKNQMPLALLREIIRRPGESISVFIQKELTPRVTSIREGAESRLDKLFRREDQLEGTSAADLLKSSQKTLEEWQGKIDERIRQGIENLVGTFPVLGRDIHSVRQKLEELEKKIDELERKP